MPTSAGRARVAAAKMAVEDFNPAAHGMKVEIVSADHQNKPDVGASIARQWFDVDHVDAIVDVPNSERGARGQRSGAREEQGVPGLRRGHLRSHRAEMLAQYRALDLRHLDARQRHRQGAGENRRRHLVLPHRRLRVRPCARTRHHGGGPGQWRPGARRRAHPLNTQDFSSFLLQAQASKAKIIGLANAGGDTINAIKQGAEFGITAGGQHFAGLLVFITDVQALGLKVAQGLVLTETFYWDMNDATRAWTKRWQAERPGKFPNMNQAGVYAATLHYLKAVAALKSAADGKAVVAKMKEMPTDDPLFGKGYIRADGRKIHPAYLFEVKKPEESKYPGDDYKLRATIPAEEAFRPLKDGNCPMVTN